MTKKDGYAIAEFILKLAQDKRLPEREAIQAIDRQYREMAQTDEFPGACQKFNHNEKT